MALATVAINGNGGNSGHTKVPKRPLSLATEHLIWPSEGSVVSEPMRGLPPTTDTAAGL